MRMYKFDHISGEYFEVEKAKIYFEETGVKDAPVLLFLHGGFGNIEDFNEVIQGLEKDFRIIGIDSRGQGKSSLGGEILSYERIQKDVEQILAHLKIDDLNIVGLSDGGITAYRLAVFSNLKIEKLVTVGSRWHIKNTDPTRELFLKITGASWKQKFPEMFEMYQKLNPEPDFDFLSKSLIKMWLDVDSSGYANEKVADISASLLIVRGDDDHLISLDVLSELSKLVKDSHILNIPFAGHDAFNQQPKIFRLALNEFLGK